MCWKFILYSLVIRVGVKRIVVQEEICLILLFWVLLVSVRFFIFLFCCWVIRVVFMVSSLLSSCWNVLICLMIWVMWFLTSCR